MAGEFDDKVVVITGASSGVGEAAACLFAARGAKVVLAARSADKLAALAKRLGGLAIPTDVTVVSDLKALVSGTISAFGHLDVLVNNAGANARGALEKINAAGIATVIDTNLKAPLLLTHFALPHLRMSRGVVVNVASIAGHLPLPGEVAYCASKWGLRGFTFAVREEMRNSGVAVCAVSPGPIATRFVLDHLDETPDLVFSQPFLKAEEVAEAIVASALDRKRERAFPFSTLRLAQLAQWMPWLQEFLRPALERKGAKAKEEWRAKERA
ncbi:MAG TPA: SDR family oxidoreductase [Myxococcota bacterium]|nr:SDR family oxidoreductase [Myxococcota bacterium]